MGDLTYPRSGHGISYPLAGEDVVGVVERIHPPLQLGYQWRRYHDLTVPPRLRLVGLEPDEPVLDVPVGLLQVGQLRDPEPCTCQELDYEQIPALDRVDEGSELGWGYELGDRGRLRASDSLKPSVWSSK